MLMFSGEEEKFGDIEMIDISNKGDSRREAVAKGLIKLSLVTIKMIKEKQLPKGDVFTVAKLAGIMGAKNTPQIIPLCHPLPLTDINIDFKIDKKNSQIEITSRVGATSKTGVEMEALVAVASAALTIYDMCKAVDKEMVIGAIRLVKKTGGQGGKYVREG